MEYKRLTERRGKLVIDKCQNCENVSNPQGCTDKQCYEIIKNRLAELEDKIEQGTLIELPCVRERKGYPNQYEAVYEINGVVQSCVIGSVKEGWRIIAYYGEDRAKVEAEKRLKELQDGRIYGIR